MRIAFIVLLLCGWAGFAHAQQDIEGLCERISQFVPIDGVEFNPNAAEVPADINRVQDPVLGSISIPVEIDLVEYFDRADLRFIPGLDLEPDIANIEVNQDGSVYYNGQEISADIKRTCGTPVPEVKDVIVSKPKPKPKPAPKSKSEKPVEVIAETDAAKPAPKKSSVSVFNGPKSVIASVPEIKALDKPVAAFEKPKPVDENAIDVEVLKAQDNEDETIIGDNDDDSILEGQYP